MWAWVLVHISVVLQRGTWPRREDLVLTATQTQVNPLMRFTIQETVDLLAGLGESVDLQPAADRLIERLERLAYDVADLVHRSDQPTSVPGPG